MSKKRKVINDNVKLIKGNYCYVGDKTIKTINDFLKTYCYNCDEPTQTIKKKREYPKDTDICLIKGNCEVCNIDKLNYRINYVDKSLYCFSCKETTDSKHRRRIYLNEENVYVSKCKICETVKIDKDIKKFGFMKLLI